MKPTSALPVTALVVVVSWCCAVTQAASPNSLLVPVGCGGTIDQDSSNRPDGTGASWAASFATSERKSALPGSRARRVFQLSFPTSASSTDSAGQRKACVVAWNPKLSLATSITSVYIAVAGPNSGSLGCGVTVSAPTSTASVSANVTLRAAQTFEAAGGGRSVAMAPSITMEPSPVFPLSLTVPFGCTLEVVLETTREGTLEWYVWGPISVWAFLALVLSIFLVNRNDARAPLFYASVRSSVFTMGVLFYGFVFCVIGLGAELANWVNPSSAFPFPNTVTFFLCMSLFFLILLGMAASFSFVVRALVFSLALKLVVQGLLLASVVLVWIQELWVLAAISLALLVFSNLAGLQMFLKLCRLLPDHGEDIIDQSMSIGALWCPPAIPFTPIAFLYVQLSMLVKRSGGDAPGSKKKGDAKDQQVVSEDGTIVSVEKVKKQTLGSGGQPHIDYVKLVTLFDAMLGVRMVFLSYLPQTIILVLATVFHPPMCVLLYFYCLLVGWEATHSIKVFLSHSREQGLTKKWGTSLWPAIKYHIERRKKAEQVAAKAQAEQRVLALEDSAAHYSSVARSASGRGASPTHQGYSTVEDKAARGLPTEPRPVYLSPDGRRLGGPDPSRGGATFAPTYHIDRGSNNNSNHGGDGNVAGGGSRFLEDFRGGSTAPTPNAHYPHQQPQLPTPGARRYSSQYE